MELTFDLPALWLLLASLAGLIGAVGLLLPQRRESSTSAHPSRCAARVSSHEFPFRRRRRSIFRRKQPSVKDKGSDEEAISFVLAYSA